MIKEYFYKNFFFFARLIVSVGILIFIYAIVSKGKSNKQINNDIIKDNEAIKENSIINAEGNVSKKDKVLMGVGVTTMVAGITLFILGILAIAFVIFICIHLISLFKMLD